MYIENNKKIKLNKNNMRDVFFTLFKTVQEIILIVPSGFNK